jgi:hypothetical protein
MPDEPEFRLYVDESGHHHACNIAGAGVGERYLGLCGVVFERGKPYSDFADDLEALKRVFWEDPDDRVVLHREDIQNRRGAFSILRDGDRRGVFDQYLLTMIEAAPIRVIAVALDKSTHGASTYRALAHPYHYALLALLERYCGWLRFAKRRGDVLVEARGRNEDDQFAEAYERFYRAGSGNAGYLSASVAQSTLTSARPKIKPKVQNIAGLQVADLLAHPLTRDVLVRYKRLDNHGGEFARRISDAVRPKYNRRFATGQAMGYGQVFLG